MTEAIYPGSFDPITNGHLDLIERARQIFDAVHVAVVTNPHKDSLFNEEKRVEMIERSIPSTDEVTVDSFNGLLVDYVQERESNVILRGLRALSDFEYEFQMSTMNKRLAEDVETVYMMAGEEYSFLSSSIVKEVRQFGGDIEDLVPEVVAEQLSRRFDV